MIPTQQSSMFASPATGRSITCRSKGKSGRARLMPQARMEDHQAVPRGRRVGQDRRHTEAVLRGVQRRGSLPPRLLRSPRDEAPSGGPRCPPPECCSGRRNDRGRMQARFRPDDEIKIDEVLEFCERVLCNVPMLWRECSLDQQQRLQQVLFPQGILYDRKTGYRTATTCLFFNTLEGNSEDKTHLVALTGIEPVSQP
jgi:hypothetical protein